MDQQLQDMFMQARAVVDEDNRRKAEEEQRKRDAEREALLRELAGRIETAFDFTSREKLDLDPRMDVLDGRGVLEFVVRSVRAIFILSQAPTGQWGLQVAEDNQPLQLLLEVDGGNRTEVEGEMRDDGNTRRLAAARIVAAIGDWCTSKERAAAAPPPPAAPAKRAGGPPTPPPPQRPQGKNPPPPPPPPSPPPPAANGPEQPRKPNVPQFGKVFGY